MPPAKNEMITSFRNEHIKNVLSLRERSVRDEKGLTIVEGWREILLAQEAGIEFREIFFNAELAKGRADQDIRIDEDPHSPQPS